MSKWRRYVYLLVDRFDHVNYPLCRIDASALFFPTTTTTTTTSTKNNTAIEDARLPKPFISFTASPSTDCGSRILDFFTLFGRGKKKSLLAGADKNGLTFIYDLSKQTIHHQLSHLDEPKQTQAVSVAVGDALYVIDRTPLLSSRCGFESLVYGEEPSTKGYENIEDWRWRCLEPPPYVLETGYRPTRIAAYTVVGGSHIWISTQGIGTYSFDTLAGTWSKAGKWVLPFRERAHYIPECDSWLGFASKSGLLCSSDLSNAAAGAGAAPVVSGVLEEAMPEFEGYQLTESYLVNLGSARFCVAKFFQREYNQLSDEGSVLSQFEKFVVLTGFVMDVDDHGGGVLRMRKHRSRRYMLTTVSMGLDWLF